MKNGKKKSVTHSKVYNGDANDKLSLIKDCSIDLLYTDPPYELNYQTNIPGDKRWNKSQTTNNRFDVLENDTKGKIKWVDIWKHFYRVLKDDSFLFLHCNVPFIMNYGNDIISAGFKYKGCVAWNKNFAIGGGLKTTMKRDWEPIYYFSKGDAEFNSVEVERNGEMVERLRISEIQDWSFTLKKTDKTGHPTQKPIMLAKQIIRLCTKEKDVVLDPFAGSGTVGVACRYTNRHSILIEKSKDFCSIIHQRLQSLKN